ncbi:MAG: peptidoglycan DD-metalloendopeptidase family protein [Rhizobiaceae bacterium]
MRVSVLSGFERNLARCAAVIAIGALAAGCSSSSVRFGSLDDLFTGSTSGGKNLAAPTNQPFPVAAAPLDPTPTGSVNRGALAPVTAMPRSDLGTRSGAHVQTAGLEPVSRSPLPAGEPPSPVRTLDPTATGSVAALPSAPLPAETNDPAGWSRAGGTQVTVRDGETLYNLSRRYGVPADVIAQVNGLPSGGAIRSGQKLVIPTYVYSSKANVSAPDANPNVADAKSSRGTKYDVPADKVPLPSAPGERLAVLPNPPKVRESEAAPALTVPGNTTANAGTYRVQEGDTLSAIARKTGTKVADLKAANGLSDGLIRVGQTLTVPGAGTIASAPSTLDPTITGAAGPSKPAKSEEVAGYTPPKKADKPIAQVAAVSEGEAPDATGIGRMRWPVKGRVIASYGSGNGKKSDGIDIAVPEGTPVKAAENGVVIYAGDGLKEFGNTVLVRHEDGLVTVYGHNGSLKVERGQKVKRGEEIALSGMSGATETPKLHFEVRKDSAPVDPAGYLQ